MSPVHWLHLSQAVQFHNRINVSAIWVFWRRYFFDLGFWFFNHNWWWQTWSFLCAFWLLNISHAVCSLEVFFSLTWKNAVMLWHPSAALLQLFLFCQSLVHESPIYITPLLPSDWVNLHDLAFALPVSKCKFSVTFIPHHSFLHLLSFIKMQKDCRVSIKTPVIQHHHCCCQCHQSHLTLSSHHQNSHHWEHCTGN